MSDVFKTFNKLKDYHTKIRKNLQKLLKNLNEIDMARANSDDFEKMAEYFDEIKCYSNRAIVKLDSLIDERDDSSDDLLSLSDLSVSSDEYCDEILESDLKE